MGGLGVDYAGSDRKTSQPVLDVLEVRNKLVRSFYSDIGVRSAFEKKSNVNSLEIDGHDSVLEFNISTMLKQRELACEKVNELFGTNWSVHVAEEIDYEKIEEEEEQKMLNQQEQFSQMNKNEGDDANEDSEDK